MARITLYRIERSAEGAQETEAEYALCPWDEGEDLGEDDGGRDYTLPDGYTLESQDGVPSIHNGNGAACLLQSYNGQPCLIDEEKKLALLIEREKKLLHRREQAGLSRQEVAEALGVTQKELYEWENNEKEPTLRVYAQLAALLGCDAFELI